LIILILVRGIFYSREEPKENVTQNITKTQEVQYNQTTTTPRMISAEEAQNIAADYMAANPAEFGNTTAGTPSLKGGVYYVPVIVTTSEGQHPPGTIVAHIRIDAKTGTILGIETKKCTKIRKNFRGFWGDKCLLLQLPLHPSPHRIQVPLRSSPMLRMLL